MKCYKTHHKVLIYNDLFFSCKSSDECETQNLQTITERLLIMKKYILLIVATIFTVGLFAQNKSTVTTIVEGDGYTYIKKIRKSRLVDLYNQENKYTNVPLVYKETGERPPFDLREKRVEDDNWTSLHSELIVNRAFTNEQKQIVRGHKLGVAIYIDSTTGKVVETEFTFPEMTPMAEIPLSVFRKIELDMKNEIYFTLTDVGKKYNYVFFYWMQEIE